MSEREAGEWADEPPGQNAGSAELLSRRRHEPVEWLTEVLDLESDGYEPNTQRIRSLVRERLNEGARGRRPVSVMRLRLAGIPAGIAAAAVCATVAVAVTATVAVRSPATAPNAAGGHSGPPAAGAAAGPSPATSGRADGGAPDSATGHAVQTVTETPSADHGSPAAPSTSDSASTRGPALLTATGALGPASNASWSEERVDLTLTEQVANFQLTIRVTPGPGLISNNVWSDHDITAFEVNITSDANGLVYRFTLKQGRTLPAGTFVIAAQFAHNGPRDAGGDTFEASATADSSAGLTAGVAHGAF